MDGTTPSLLDLAVTDDLLVELYTQLGSVWKVGEFTGLSGQYVHKRLRKLGVTFAHPPMTDQEKQIITAYYNGRTNFARGEFNLDILAASLGRSKSLVCRTARELGLTNRNRSVPQSQRDSASDFFRAWHEHNEHPRGMLGKKHNAATRAVIADFSRRYWDSIAVEQRTHRADEFRRTTRNNGWTPSNNNYSRARRGLREDLGIYVRSSWEANYARILNHRVADPLDPLDRWEYEPDTFWFDKIKRGTRSYLPDFKLFEDGREPYYVEVKGWMDQKSRTKLDRMARYFPDVELRIVDAAAYRLLEKEYSTLPEWELAQKVSRSN